MDKLYITLIVVLTFIGCSNSTDTYNTTIPGQKEQNSTPYKFSTPHNFWWPEQKPASSIVICDVNVNNFQDIKNHALAQSLAGLAAKAVNNDKLNELVWLSSNRKSYKEWFSRMLQKRNYTIKDTLAVWDLVKRYYKKGIIEGYVVYKQDTSPGGLYTERPNIDESLNVATVIAGMEKAILVEQSDIDKVDKLGIPKIADATKTNYREVYEKYKNKLYRDGILTVDPAVPHNRALAIAHGMMTYYGVGSFYEKLLKWLNPISPILGWNRGGEINFVAPATKYAHFTTASTWAINMTVLMAGSRLASVKKVNRRDPASVDFSDERSAHSFIMSDGDNVAWLLGGFSISNRGDYWDNPNRQQVPVGWTASTAHMRQIAPVVNDYLSETQANEASIIEYGGGYQYPDLFGISRQNPEILKKFAQKINAHLQMTGVPLFGFIVKDIDSPAAQRAYRVFARELENIIGMIVVQYAPYEAGDGDIYWVENKKGVEIPVVSAKYALWANLEGHPRAGNPSEIAKMINKEGEEAARRNEPNQSWTVVHAWSYFNKIGPVIVDANPGDPGAERGLTPVKWTIDEIDSENVNVVSPEELIWRIRMQKHPEVTKQIIN